MNEPQSDTSVGHRSDAEIVRHPVVGRVPVIPRQAKINLFVWLIVLLLVVLTSVGCSSNPHEMDWLDVLIDGGSWLGTLFFLVIVSVWKMWRDRVSG